MSSIVQKGVVVFIAFCALSGIGGVILAGLIIYSRATS
ncbi:protein YohO [Budvicia diplopodorum]